MLTNFRTIIQLLSLHWIIFTLLSGCVSPAHHEQNGYAQQQRQSLASVFYKGNSLPPPPTTEEINEVRKKVRSANPWERSLLEELYPDDPELWVYATRDIDADGLNDFWISDYYGRFLEGDTDLDGDGVENVLDTAPFDRAVGKQAPVSIPPKADWARQGKPAEMARIQRELFDNHSILLLERSAEFTPELARSVNDVVTRVYQQIFDAGASDFAQVMAASQTLEIYRRGIDAVPVIQLGFLAHEIAHNIQFAYDYDAQRQDEIMRRNYFAAPRFLELAARYGWTSVSMELEPETEFTLFRPHYVILEPYEHLYLEESVQDWEVWLTAIYDEVGPEHYLADERITELNILGDYSLSGPWEWYSDYVIAYLYIEMLDSLAVRCPLADREALADVFQNETVYAEWPYFRFENARGAEILTHMREEYPLDPATLAYLAENYLLTLHPDFCNTD